MAAEENENKWCYIDSHIVYKNIKHWNISKVKNLQVHIWNCTFEKTFCGIRYLMKQWNFSCRLVMEALPKSSLEIRECLNYFLGRLEFSAWSYCVLQWWHADFTTILCFVCRATNYWLCANSIDELPHVFFEEHNKSKELKVTIFRA